MKPTPAQRQAIEISNRPLIVQAGAGTGKTWVLVQRFIHLLETHPDWPLESVVAVTFTEKAAREMRTRLRQAIDAKAREHPQDGCWQEHRRQLDRLQVGTIHSLCARILRENAIAARIDPRFQVIDEQETELLRENTIRATLQTLEEEAHPALALLASLQVSDLRSEMGNMLAHRGTLTLLFNNLPDPSELLSTWQAGLVQMREDIWRTQLQNNPEMAGAIALLPAVEICDPQDLLAHSVLLAQAGCEDYQSGNLVAAARKWMDINLKGGKAGNWGGKELFVELKNNLKLLRAAARTLDDAGALQEVGPLDELAVQHLGLWQSLWERLNQVYAAQKDELQALDFDDLELLTHALLHQDPHPPRLDAYLEGLNHLMVDEFQDTNIIQQQIVNALAPVYGSPRLFVVGDAKQSIYRFRQAQVRVYNQTAAEIRAATGQSPVNLDTSFRAHRELVAGLNRLFTAILRPAGETHADFEAAPTDLRADRDSRTASPPPLELLLLPTEDPEGKRINAEETRIWEARWLAQRIQQLRQAGFMIWDKHADRYRPFEYRDAAVLFRATTSLPLYETEFKAAGVPYLTVSGRGYYDRPEVQDLIALLSALSNPGDDLNLAAALRSPLFSFNDETLYRLRWYKPDGTHPADPIPYLQALATPPETDQDQLVARAGKVFSQLLTLTGRVDVWQLLRQALDLTGYEATLSRNDGETGRQRTNVQKFLALARQQRSASLPDFLGRLRDLKAREAREGEAPGREPESGAVQLMSIHASKGLEFPVVFLADLGRKKSGRFGSPYLLHDPAFGILCKVRAESGDWIEPAGYAWGKWYNERLEEAERKRLLYVACTRAADLLVLSGKLGGTDTWLADVLAALEIPSEGEPQSVHSFPGFELRVHRPADMAEPERQAEPPLPAPIQIEAIPALALPIELPPEPGPIAASDLDAALRAGPESTTQPAPALFSPVAAQPDHPPGQVIGRILHKALAHWECLADPAPLLQARLESYAHRESLPPPAVEAAVDRSAGIVHRLTQHPLYTTITSSPRRYPELPFTLTTPAGIVHGILDLLYQDSGGCWQLLDWKTEWTPLQEIQAAADKYLLQMVVYARAAARRLGEQPEVSLCFLVPRVHIYTYPPDMLASKWVELEDGN